MPYRHKGFLNIMKKRIILGLLTLLVLGALPYLSGQLIKHELQRLITSLPVPEGVSLKLDDYHVRYARSWAQLEVTVEEPAYGDLPFPHLFEENAENHVSYVRLKIFHGPIFPMEVEIKQEKHPEQALEVKETLAFGLGRIAFYAKAKELAPSNPMLQDALENFFEKNDILAGNARINLLGTLTTHMSLASSYYKSPEGSFTFGGIDGYITVSRDLNTVRFDVNIAPLLLQGKHNAMIDMSAMQLRSDGTRTADTPWVGTQTVSLPSFYLHDEEGNTIRFSKFDLKTESQVKSGLATITLNAAASDVEIFGEQIPDAQFKLALDTLDAKGLADFSRVTQPVKGMDEATWQAKRRDALIAMFKRGAHVMATYALKVPEGNVLANAEARFPDLQADTGTPEHLAKEMILKLNASLSLHAPLVWLESTLYHMALPHLPADAPPVIDPNTKKAIPAPEALRMEITEQFNELNAAHILITDQAGNTAFNLRYEAGNVLLNGKALTSEDLVKLMTILGG